VIAYWRKMTKSIVPFDPYYIPRNLSNRAKDNKRGEDIVAILDTMEAKEMAVKAAEVKIRREHDYTNVLSYLQSVSSLHNTEKEGRNYLIGEVEMCRAKVLHAEESIGMLNQQLTELENRHEFVKENWVANLGHVEQMGNEYFETIVQDQSDKQNVNNLVRRQLLDVRTVGDENFPGEEHDDPDEDAKVARGKSDATIRANNYEEISQIHDTEQLLRRLGVRNRRERRALKAELRDSLKASKEFKQSLEETTTKLETETKRADDADETLRALRAQNDQFIDMVASREAVVETEANEYFDIAGDAVSKVGDLEQKINSVVPTLMNMILMGSEIGGGGGGGGGVNGTEVVKEATKALVGLGAMTPSVAPEHLESVSMLREEITQKEAEIMATVKRAKTPKKGAKGAAGKKEVAAKRGGAKKPGKKR